MFTRFKQFLKDDTATASVEFVMIAPLYLASVFSVFEAGWLMTKNMMLERGLDQTVRDIRLGKAGLTQHAEFVSAICDYARILRDCEDNMILEVTPINNSTDIPSGAADCRDRSTPPPPPGTHKFNLGNRTDVMYVRACVIVDPLLPGLGLGLHLPKNDRGDFEMIAYSAFVNEPA